MPCRGFSIAPIPNLIIGPSLAFNVPGQSEEFVNNLAIMGGLLVLAAFGPGPISVDKA